MNNLDEAREALQAARALRHTYLAFVWDGHVDPIDVVHDALDPANAALRTVRLDSIFTGQVFNHDRTKVTRCGTTWPAVKQRLLTALDIEDPTDKKLTVGWIIDSRTGGRRWYALQDALRPRDEPPWPGFPWKPPPD